MVQTAVKIIANQIVLSFRISKECLSYNQLSGSPHRNFPAIKLFVLLTDKMEIARAFQNFEPI